MEASEGIERVRSVGSEKQEPALKVELADSYWMQVHSSTSTLAI